MVQTTGTYAIPFKRGFVKADPKGGSNILYRHATPSDAEHLATLYDKVYEGGYPLKDCLDPVRVKSIIEGNEHIWMVALDGDKVVGATVSRPETWNRSYETCRSVTDPDPRYAGRGIGTILYDAALHAALSREDCDMTFGYPRTLTMKHLMERPNPPITVVGIDNGMHLVSGERENHLFSVIYNPYRTINRVVDRDPLFNKISGLRKLMNQFGLETTTGSYPSDSIVGPKAQGQHKSEHGVVRYSYFQPSKCASITDVVSQDAEGARQAIWAFIGQFRDPEHPERIDHASMYLLADKKFLFQKLREPLNGDPSKLFHLSAYIPAWHHEDGKRYDCLSMTARFDPSLPKTFDTSDIITQFHIGLNTKVLNKEKPYEGFTSK